MSNNTIRITLDVEPKGQMRPRFFSKGKVQKTYKAAQQKAEESKLLGLLYQYAPAQPLSGPVSISIAAFLPVPRSWPKWKQRAATEGKVMPAKAPDADNIIKMILDVFNGVFWEDDKQIVALSAEKHYSEKPRWEIEMKPLSDEGSQNT